MGIALQPAHLVILLLVILPVLHASKLALVTANIPAQRAADGTRV